MPAGAQGFGDQALTLTDDGGPNLINSAVTVNRIMEDTYVISGLDALTSAEGSYTLTVNATEITDPSGNPGVGSGTVSWLMDTTPPTSTVNPLPAQTTATSFTVSVTGSDPNGSDGGPPSGIASFAIYDSVNGGPYQFLATVTPAAPSTTFTGQPGHTYGFYSIATDNAGNVEAAPASAEAQTTIESTATPPPASSDLAISPDTGFSSTDGITDTGSLTLTGSLGQTGLTVDVNDTSTHTDLGAATVSATSFSLGMNLAAGTHVLDVTAKNAAGLTADTLFTVVVNETPPAAPTDLTISPDAGSSSNDGITDTGSLTFSGQLGATGLEVHLDDVTTGTALPDATVSGTSFSAPLNLAEGVHDIRATAEDVVGNTSSADLVVTVNLTPPTSTAGVSSPVTTSTSFPVTVTATDPTGSGGSPPSDIASVAVYDSTDGGPYSLLTTLTPATVSAGFTGQVMFTGQVGHSYAIFSVATDVAGNVQATPTSAQATVQVVPPVTVSTIAAVSPNPRNSAVSSVNVTLSGPINTASLTHGALTLTDNGGASLINAGVTIGLVSGTTATYQIGGLAGADGRRRELHADGQRLSVQGHVRQPRLGLAVHELADGHHAAH